MTPLFLENMSQKISHVIAYVGLALQLAIPIGLICAAAAMFTMFGAMDGDVAQAASQITGGVARAVLSLVAGELISLIGIWMLAIALFGGKFRAAWLPKWGRRAMIFWLVVFTLHATIAALLFAIGRWPIELPLWAALISGAFFAIRIIMLFSRSRAEFLPKETASDMSRACP